MSDDKPTTTPPKADNATKTLATLIEGRQASFAAVATKYLPPDRLVKLAQVIIGRVPDLGRCTSLSVLDSLMTCSRLGLEPNVPGGVWLIPRNMKIKRQGQPDEWQMTCTSIIDYRGMLDVARRGGDVAAVHAAVRCANDAWEFAIDTTGDTLVVVKHRPAEGDRGAILGAYFVAKLTTGQCQAVYLTKTEIEGYRGRSKATGFSPWESDWAAMAVKTAARRGVNLLPKSPDVQALREELTKEDERQHADIDVMPEPAAEVVETMLGTFQPDQRKAIVEAMRALDYSAGQALVILRRFDTQSPSDGPRLLQALQAEHAARTTPNKGGAPVPASAAPTASQAGAGDPVAADLDRLMLCLPPDKREEAIGTFAELEMLPAQQLVLARQFLPQDSSGFLKALAQRRLAVSMDGADDDDQPSFADLR
jgi:recombination protein RecT